MPRVAIGVDIGGTSVKLGLVTGKGKVLLRDSFLTSTHTDRKELLDKLITHIDILKKEARYRKLKLMGAGIGAPGPIDVERGFVYSFPNIRGWENTPLKELLRKKTKMPVFVDNDANAMAWGEFCFGAGKGAKDVVAITLGTGIGGGLVIGGKLFHGQNFSAAEIGHMIVDPNGCRCACGNRGCIETFVGSGYFVSAVRSALKSGQKSILRRWIATEKRELTPKLVQDAARQGDAFSKAQWRKAGESLGTFLAGIANLLNPQRIIIGGGIAQGGDLILVPVRSALKKKAFPIAARFVKVVPAALGVDAGLVGAAALAISSK
jgi:glucokinase